MEQSVIIIGSGLGGLECGYILARKGMKVTVLERDRNIGGCLQTFRRKGSDGRTHIFDTGFHYVGGLGEGQSLYPLFRYFGLLDLPWKRLDTECFDEVVFTDDDRRYPFASSYDGFAGRLAEMFPAQKDALGKYAELLRSTGDNIFRAFSPDSGMNSLFGTSAYGYLADTVADPKLRKVLSGTSLKLELKEDTLPLYEFAQINSSFVQSAWRLGSAADGLSGGAAIAGSLAAAIRKMGGEIHTSAEVTSINAGDSGKVSGVNVNGETLTADWVISDAHPAATVGLIGECREVRKIYRGRMRNLRNTGGMFTANIILKSGAMPYLNRNVFVHSGDADLWNPDSTSTGSVMVHFYPIQDGVENGDAVCIDLLSPMSWDGLEGWSSSVPGRRGGEYEALKKRKLQECVELADKGLKKYYREGFSTLWDCIDAVYTSSPLTWHSYTGSPQGSAYGVAKDWNNPMGTILSPRTPLRNLLMTGQSLNLHGILGVSMTSVLTCSALLGSLDPDAALHLQEEILKK